jgi:hypothetical protein
VDKVRRIALVGNGATTRASDGFEGEIWTTASVAKILPRVDRVFEVHKEYDAARLNGYKCPIMTDGFKDDISACEDLYIDALVKDHGPMFQFSFDYMMAYALDCLLRDIENGVEKHIEVTTYGIDLTTDSEYNQFRQSFFYWIGMLRGSGITVNISQGSAIFSRRWVYCHERDEIAEASAKLIKSVTPKIAEFETRADEARLGVAFANGYKQCAEDMRAWETIR